MVPIQSVIPFGCTVEVYNTTSTVHAPDGSVIAIVCGELDKDGAAGAELRARLIVEIPRLLSASAAALDAGMLLPLEHGLRSLELAVQPPPDQLPV